MIDAIWDFADELGPEKIIHLYDPSVGLRAIVVIDNVVRGPSIGGVRIAVDASLQECFRLARAMTLKNAAALLPHGGGKAVIIADPKMDIVHKEQLIRSFARAIRQLKDYIPGPDMGTNETCMAWCYDEIERAAGLPPELGGIPLDAIGATAYGLCASAEVAIDYCDLVLEGARVVIQGFGSVGLNAARFLADKGAQLIAVADSQGAVTQPQGLDLDALISHKQAGNSVQAFQGGSAISNDDLLDVPCDIFIPAARPDLITSNNVDRVSARLILCGANIPVSLNAERTLYQRGVMVVPDFIVNAGGVICAAVEYAGGSIDDAFSAIKNTIRENTRTVLNDSLKLKEPPRTSAVALAIKRIKMADSKID